MATSMAGQPFRGICTLTVAVVCSILMPVVARADTVKLRDGQSVFGIITGETAEAIAIETAKGRFTFPRKNVTTFTRESPVDNQKRQLQRLISEGKLDLAFQLLAADPSLQAALPTHAFNQVLITSLAGTANAVTVTSQTASELYRRLTAPMETPPELALFSASLCMDYAMTAEALVLLRRVEQKPPVVLQWPSVTIAGLLDRIATSALKARDGVLLAMSASLAAKLPITKQPATDQLGHYAVISELIRKKEYLEATVQFRPDLFLHRADLFAPLAERLVTAIVSSPPTDAALAALQSSRATILPYLDLETQTLALKSLVGRLLEEGKTTEAQAVADETAADNADLGALLQHLIEFRSRQITLKDSAPLDKYKLAAWARSMGLLLESRALFLELRSDPRFTETVNLQLSLLETALAQAGTRRLRNLYDKGEFDRMRAEASEFLRTSPPEAYAREAKDLLQLAEFEKWNSSRTSQNQAEAEFQQAERLAQRGEYDQALLQLNRIQIDRSDSAAALKAQNLRDRVMREKLRLPRVTTGTLP